MINNNSNTPTGNASYSRPSFVFSFNKQIACTPFASLSVEIEKKSGLAFAKQKNTLLETTIQYPYKADDAMTMQPGWRVFIDGEVAKGQMWSRKVYKIGPEPKDGEEDRRLPFILVPEACLLMVDSGNQYPYTFPFSLENSTSSKPGPFDYINCQVTSK